LCKAFLPLSFGESGAKNLNGKNFEEAKGNLAQT
jgi:hypothetical protein